jgi:cytochrome P450
MAQISSVDDATPDGAAMVEYPSTKLIDCPYPFFDEARVEHPVARSATTGEFLVFGHKEIAHVLRRTDIFSSVFPEGRPNFDYHGATMISAYDPPEHKTIRSFAYRPVTPGRLKGYEPIARRVAEQLVDTFADRGTVEIVRDFAAPLPAQFMCTLMNLPTEGDEYLKILSYWGGNGTGVTGSIDATEEEKAERSNYRNEYIAGKLRERHEEPGEDILSELVQAQIERDGEFDLPYLVPISNELLAGGIITTAQLIGSAMALLLRHPDQLAAMISDRKGISRMLEETLRCESPVQSQDRIAARDTELGGVKIPAGSRVLAVLSSGNRDDTVFEDPERFDTSRPMSTLKRHYAFGYGAHFCLGAPLARLEATVAFNTLFDRLENFRLAQPEELNYAPTTHFRAITELQVAFDKRGD